MKKLLEKIRRDFLHNVLGWGYPTTRTGGDSFQSVYGCRFCNGELTMDSQLNWFHLSHGKGN